MIYSLRLIKRDIKFFEYDCFEVFAFRGGRFRRGLFLILKSKAPPSQPSPSGEGDKLFQIENRDPNNAHRR